MASPSELSLEEIRKYLLDNGGSARNQDLVKHFKRFLTDPETRVEARNRFKEYINTLATIKTEEGEKYLVLKRKFRQPTLDLSSPTLNFSSGIPGSPISTPDLATPTSPLREPPPYRPPPIALSPVQNISSPVRRYTAQDPPIGLPAVQPIGLPNVQPVGLPSVQPVGLPIVQPVGLPNVQSVGIPVVAEPISEDVGPSSVSRYPATDSESGSSVSSPPVPPRKKSVDKFKMSNKENQFVEKAKNGAETIKGTEEDDRASVVSQLDGKSREWLVKAAQGDYQALAKLAAEEPRLARTKDPSSGYTALHWGAKHGDENIVKLIAGTYGNYIKSVNETTNGGYTPLHIALQFDHENIFALLVQVYGANQEIRDYSGKKPRQYSISQKAAVSQDTMRKIKARKKHAEKDLGFLRIGSLNVRVKRTTEAFSQFLGVATNNASNNNEKIHKSWGSADNLPADKIMPPPKYAPIKKRRSRRATDFGLTRQQHAASQPTTPTPTGKSSTASRRPASVSALTTSSLLAQQTNPVKAQLQQNDSDSDGACGFDSAWRGSA